MNGDVFVRTLWDQVTVYDKDGNVIKMIPEPPPVPPKVTYFNIVEFENKLMGINPEDEIPDFFIDFETDERFKDIRQDPEFKELMDKMDYYSKVCPVLMVMLALGSIAIGYLI